MPVQWFWNHSHSWQRKNGDSTPHTYNTYKYATSQEMYLDVCVYTKAANEACMSGCDFVELAAGWTRLPWWVRGSSNQKEPPAALPASPSSSPHFHSSAPWKTPTCPPPPSCLQPFCRQVWVLSSVASFGVLEHQSLLRIVNRKIDKQNALCHCVRSACASSGCCSSWMWVCIGCTGEVSPRCGPWGACKLFSVSRQEGVCTQIFLSSKIGKMLEMQPQQWAVRRAHSYCNSVGECWNAYSRQNIFLLQILLNSKNLFFSELNNELKSS